MTRPPAVRGVSYYTDASVLQPPSHVPTVIFGPGDERLAHQPDEKVPVIQVLQAAAAYAVLAERLLLRS
jgi:succinyl-diaminopimelate desuccinylase